MKRPYILSAFGLFAALLRPALSKPLQPCRVRVCAAARRAPVAGAQERHG